MKNKKNFRVESLVHRNRWFYEPAKLTRAENNFNKLQRACRPCPVQWLQSYLAIPPFTSIQASSAMMSNEQQARKMLTAVANTAGGFDYAGECYTACCAFLFGTDPSMPSKALVPPNEQNID
jgi:hypothetical protein